MEWDWLNIYNVLTYVATGFSGHNLYLEEVGHDA